MRTRWTDEEIDTIKSGFLAGKLVKIIADEVGRSPTAVNKFLSRSGIRQRRWTIDKQAKARKVEEFEVSRETLNKVYSDRIISNFHDVLEYLKENGISISKNNKKAFAPMDDYAINDKPVSRVKLLLIANRLRRENHLPVFAVPSLTWE